MFKLNENKFPKQKNKFNTKIYRSNFSTQSIYNEFNERNLNDMNYFDKNKNIETLFYKPVNKEINLNKMLLQITSKHSESKVNDHQSILFDIKGNFNNNPKNKLTVCMISPNQGGGTSKYIADIMNNYRDVDFIVCHEKNTLNTIKFKKNDIIWIHHFFLSDIELNYLIKLKTIFNLRIVISIHDMYFLSDTVYRNFGYVKNNMGPWENNYLYFSDEEIKIDPSIINLFDNADLIIHPTKFTFDIFSKFFNNFKFVIYDHIDFTIGNEKQYVPNIENDIINIASLSSFSNYKGKEQITFLYKNVTEYKKYKINYIVVGLTINSYLENEFFDIIDKYKIHGLLHLNRVGETWCYSLTKSLCTKLPIFYNNFGSFKERIDSRCHVINDENEMEYFDFNKLKINYEKFLDKIIDKAASVKRPKNNKYILEKNSMYDFVLNPNLKFDNFNFLNTNLNVLNMNININVENLVIINSKIIVSNNEFSYSSIRSIYTAEERYMQLLETINSIKIFIPDSYIILIDNSKLDKDKFNILKREVNLFVNDFHEQLNYLTDNSIYKGCGELAQLLYLFNNYLLKIPNVTYKNLIKISGRYKIIGNIDHILNTDDNVFKLNTNIVDRLYYYTSFYKIINYKFMNYYKALLRLYSNLNDYSKDLEVNLPFCLNYDFTTVNRLNVQQNIAVWNDKSII